MTTDRMRLRRMILAAIVTVAPTVSLVATASSAPTPSTVAGDLACVWVGQLNTGVCVQPPTEGAPNSIH